MSSKRTEKPLEKISKSQQRRQVLALNQLAFKLTQLTPTQCKKLALNSEILAALDERRHLHDKASLERFTRYIGKLLRQLPSDEQESLAKKFI